MQKNMMDNLDSWRQLNTARSDLEGAGTQTAAIGFGGESPISSATEDYDGTSWTAV
jgi:hypothetical protein